MSNKEARTSIFYVRIKPKNHAWVKREMKRHGFKSKSEYTDTLLELAQAGQKRIIARKKKRGSRKK